MDRLSRKEITAYYVGMHDTLIANSHESNEKVTYNKIQRKLMHAVMPEWTDDQVNDFGQALYAHKKTGLLKKITYSVMDDYKKWMGSQ